MEKLPWAWAANTVVGRVSDGIAVGLLSVEVWPNRVVMHLAAYADDRTRELSARWHAQLATWKQTRQGAPPRDPSVTLLDELDVQVQDEFGTRYARSVGTAGGEEGEWSSTLYFPGNVAGPLILTFTSRSGTTHVTVPDR